MLRLINETMFHLTHNYFMYMTTFLIHIKKLYEVKCPGPLHTKIISLTPMEYYNED